MDGRNLGLWVVGAGAVIIVIGLLIMSGGLSWFGRLPGDIRIESDRVRVYVPIVSMLIVSVAISVVVALVRKLM